MLSTNLRDFVLDNLAKKEKQVLDALRIETYTPEWKPQLDRIHLQNGTYFLDERGFVPEKELCLNRLPVEYQPDAPAPTKWLEFLDGLLIPEDILTLQEYLGYLLIPSTKAQKMLVMTGKGGEGKSRIGLLLKKLFGEASHSESILRIETNRFASAELVGVKPLHLAGARPFCRLKAPLGLSLLRKREPGQASHGR